LKYLVTECNKAYAVVLSDDGRFLKVANLNFNVGQKVDTVISMDGTKKKANITFIRNIAVAAACFLIIIAAAFQTVYPYGTVQITINPDIKLTVNRLNYVIDATPLNSDGEALLKDYKLGIAKVDTVLDRLADKAVKMGYLKNDGEITVTVSSHNKKWQTATEDRIIAELKVHIGDEIIIIPADGDIANNEIDDKPNNESTISDTNSSYDNFPDDFDDDDDDDDDDDKFDRD
jgi:hypothetical protein